MINVIPWLAVQFGINYTHKVSNFTRLRLVKLQTLLVQLIPNCNANHGITYVLLESLTGQDVILNHGNKKWDTPTGTAETTFFYINFFGLN